MEVSSSSPSRNLTSSPSEPSSSSDSMSVTLAASTSASISAYLASFSSSSFFICSVYSTMCFALSSLRTKKPPFSLLHHSKQAFVSAFNAAIPSMDNLRPNFITNISITFPFLVVYSWGVRG